MRETVLSSAARVVGMLAAPSLELTLPLMQSANQWKGRGKRHRMVGEATSLRYGALLGCVSCLRRWVLLGRSPACSPVTALPPQPLRRAFHPRAASLQSVQPLGKERATVEREEGFRMVKESHCRAKQGAPRCAGAAAGAEACMAALSSDLSTET